MQGRISMKILDDDHSAKPRKTSVDQQYDVEELLDIQGHRGSTCTINELVELRELHKNRSTMLYYYLALSVRCNMLVNTDIFNQFVLLCIILAGVLVGVQTYDAFENDTTCDVLNQFVLYIFLLECVLKIVAEG
jgi:hypothetical protein